MQELRYMICDCCGKFSQVVRITKNRDYACLKCIENKKNWRNEKWIGMTKRPQCMDLNYQDLDTYKKTWINFVETNVVNFFNDNKKENLTIEDGRGNKAKLKRQIDGSIKIEHTYKIIV